MTDPHKTAVALLADRSGSMLRLRLTAQEAINEFVVSQAVRIDQAVTVRLDEFDGGDWHLDKGAPTVPTYHNVWPSTPATDCPAYELVPRGMTALYDAMVRSMTEFGAELAALPEPERPGTVIWAVMTDGHENASKEYTAEAVTEKITEQREQWNWQIVFLGSDAAAVEEAIKMGVPTGTTMIYAASHVGTHSTVSSLDRLVTASAAGATEFTEDERARSKRQDPS